MSTIHLMIFLPFIFAIIVPLIDRLSKRKVHTGAFVLVVPLVLFVYLLQYIPEVVKGNISTASFSWIPDLNFTFTVVIDGFSLLFGLLISGMGVLVVLYSIYYLAKEREALAHFYVYLLLFMGAMLGVVFSDHLMILYVFWELTSISSFLLIAYWYERKASRQGALKALLITVTGGFFMLAGFILLKMMGDTYSFRELIDQADELATHPFFLAAMILLLIGTFTKSAQFPFSIWLPDAMEAPTPVSAYLHSATMVKAGIYLVARLTPLFGGHALWFWLVSGVGLVTLLYGSWTAIKQTDLKALLAYSTISQLGLVMSLIGVGSLAFYFREGPLFTIFATALFAGIFHLFNHSTFKGSLFMVVGIIDLGTGTRDIRRLGGLLHLMPITFTVAVISGFSMAGLPPFNGFLSKEMFFQSMLDVLEIDVFGLKTWGILFPVIAWVASVFTFVYAMILIFKTFTGKFHPERLNRPVREMPFGMLFSPIILALIVIGGFFFPNTLSKFILQPSLYSLLPEAEQRGIGHISIWHGFTPAFWLTVGVVLFGILLYLTQRKWRNIYHLYPKKLTLNGLYYGSLNGYERLSYRVTTGYMTGSLRHYLLYIFTFLTLVMVISLIRNGNVTVTVANNHPVAVIDIVIVIGIIAAAIATLLTNSRIAAIVSLSAVGYLVVLLYVIFRAPDLALTQMVVETVTTVLFLLCFYHLPKLEKRLEPVKFKLTNGIVSVTFGLLVTVLSILAFNHKLFPPITSFFENSFELAGGKNIVNTILVDFRGFDTMLEISVLVIAGLGVYSLIRLGLKERDTDES